MEGRKFSVDSGVASTKCANVHIMETEVVAIKWYCDIPDIQFRIAPERRRESGRAAALTELDASAIANARVHNFVFVASAEAVAAVRSHRHQVIRRLVIANVKSVSATSGGPAEEFS